MTVRDIVPASGRIEGRGAPDVHLERRHVSPGTKTQTKEARYK